MATSSQKMDTSALLTHLYDQVRVATRSVTVLGVAAVIAVIWTLRVAVKTARRKVKTTSLRGPPRTNLIYGASKELFESSDVGPIYEHWAKEYGPVYEVPTTLGGSKTVLCDPKAIAHFYVRETWSYVQLPSSRRFLQRTVGHFTQLVRHSFHVTISSLEMGYCRQKAKSTRGRHDHYLWPMDNYLFTFARQRKSMTPAFSHAAIRNLTPIFYNSAYKVIHDGSYLVF